jgi:hypothetical protein
VENRLLRCTNAHQQERRALARRGSAIAPVMAIGLRRVITFTTHDRTVPHGWLTPAAPGAALDGRRRIIANVRRRFAWAIRLTTTAGSRQPLLVYDVGSLKNGDIRGAQTHVLQERRPSARRGSAIAPAALSVSCRTRMLACHGELTPRPWWFSGADICRRNCDLCDTRTLVYKSGGPEPAVVCKTDPAP